MVSSKCCQVESPSPFRFLAAFIPPCAHTECERLTGTMENRSTCPPISATLMTAAKPASPPPTTMILGLDAIEVRVSLAASPFRGRLLQNPAMLGLRPLLLEFLLRPLRLGITERPDDRETHDDEQQGHRDSELLHAGASLVADHQAPLGGEQEKSISEVPGCGGHAHDVRCQGPWILKFVLYLPEGGIGMVEEVHAREAHVPSVIQDVGECDDPGPALCGVSPVSGPGISGANIGVAPPPDINAIKGMEGEGNPDPQQLQPKNERQPGEELHLAGVGFRPIGGERVGDEMFDQVGADRKDAAQRVQTPPKE